MTPVDKFHACLYEAEMYASRVGGLEHARYYLLGARIWIEENPALFDDSHKTYYNRSAVKCGFQPVYQRLKDDPTFFGEMEYL